MKEALTNKERMLHIYENSMADLSTKMSMLKKSLEEKVCLDLVKSNSLLMTISITRN